MRTDLDCADLYSATVRVLSRHTGYDADLTCAVLAAYAAACRSCGEECDRHEHCRICAEVCRRCEQACEQLMESLG